jgi:glutamine synthetase
MNGKDLAARVKEDGVKFISLQFTDVTGAVKSVDIPANRVQTAMKDGIWFDGSSRPNGYEGRDMV